MTNAARGRSDRETTPDGVIVLGVDSQIGLSIVRELGEHGVPVYGVGRSGAAVGLYSRHLREGFVHGRRNEKLVGLLRHIGTSRGAPFIMTVSEGDILFLNRHREALAPLRPLVPSLDAIELVVDKQRVYAVAERLGIRTPQNHVVNADGSVTGSESLTYPVILKWARPDKVAAQLRAHGLTLNKAEYCHSADELERALGRYKAMGVYPMVQSYCPGYGLGQMIYMHKGEPVLRFQHRRLHEWPPEGGYSTLCQSEPVDRHPELMTQSVELLREVGWEGPAMVEYRFDQGTGNAVLMEINGRFWGSLPLAYHARARFAVALYALMGKGEWIDSLDQYKSGIRCKFLLPDAKRLARIVLYPKKIPDRSVHFNPVAETVDFLVFLANPFNRYYIFSWRDPAPFFAELRMLLGRWRHESRAG